MINRCGARTKEERRAWLKQAQGYPLKMKSALTEIRIREWYEAFDGNVYVAFSGGKDSTVMLDLVRRLYPDVPAVFADTGNELDSVLEFVKTYGDRVTWVKPKMSFWEIVEEHGWPVISKNTCMGIDRFVNTKSFTQKKLRAFGGINPTSGKAQAPTVRKKWHYVLRAVLAGEFKTTNKCCGVLKIAPTKPYEKETGRVPFVGTMAAESMTREQSYADNGCNTFDASSKVSRPIMFWTEQDVIGYIKELDLPISKAYYGHSPFGETRFIQKPNGDWKCAGDQRTGCKFCLFGVHLEDKDKPNRIQRLYERERDSYDDFIAHGGGEVMDFLGVDSKPFVQPDMQMDLLDDRYELPAKEVVV